MYNCVRQAHLNFLEEQAMTSGIDLGIHTITSGPSKQELTRVVNGALIKGKEVDLQFRLDSLAGRHLVVRVDKIGPTDHGSPWDGGLYFQGTVLSSTGEIPVEVEGDYYSEGNNSENLGYVRLTLC